VEIKELLYEGDGEKIFATDQEDQVVFEFNDYVSSSGSGKKEKVKGKAEANNAINCSLFEYLESYNVPTHFIQKVNDKSFLAKRTTSIPIIISVWNIATGDLAKRFAIENGKTLEYPVVEMFLKDEKLKMPMISEYHAYALGLCDRKSIGNILKISTKINAVLKSYFDRKNLKLVNFKIEFGQLGNQILLGDSLTSDSMTIWTVNESGKFEKFKSKDSNKSDIYNQLRALIAKEK